MKKKILYYIKEIIVFILIMTVLANAISLYKSSDLNQVAFNLENVNLIDNTTYQPDKSKPILLHIWATWCPTCKLEAGNINTISKDFQVLTVAVKSGSDEKINHYLNENDFNFKVVNDKDAVIAREYNVAAYPTTFIYDKNGELVFSDVGYTSTIGLYFRMWWASF